MIQNVCTYIRRLKLFTLSLYIYIFNSALQPHQPVSPILQHQNKKTQDLYPANLTCSTSNLSHLSSPFLADSTFSFNQQRPLSPKYKYTEEKTSEKYSTFWIITLSVATIPILFERAWHIVRDWCNSQRLEWRLEQEWSNLRGAFFVER